MSTDQDFLPSDSGPWTRLADIVDRQHAHLRRLSGAESPPDAVPTGLLDLDRAVGGFRPGELWVVAAAPGMGATSLAFGFIRSVALWTRLPVVLFSLSAGEEEIATRMLAAEADVPLMRLRTGALRDGDADRLALSREVFRHAPIYVDSSCALSGDDIWGRVIALERWVSPALIVVDDIDTMEQADPDASLATHRRAVTTQLSVLARALNATIVALSRVDVRSGSNHAIRPTIRHLRAAGVESAADVAVLISREDAYVPDSPRAGEVDLIVAKHPWVGSASMVVVSQLHYGRFADFIDA